MKWSIGVTTVPSRRNDLLPKTLASLEAAGFDKPRLFVDGAMNDCGADYERQLLLEVTVRRPIIHTHGNWLLGMMELFIRNPDADRFIMFQDDVICSKGLREYLERVPYPQRGYLNLYTFPANEGLAQGRVGFYPSNQRGRGALALCFDQLALLTLLASPLIHKRPLDANGWRRIDGGVIDAMAQAGFKEWVHNPSLTFHAGAGKTTMNRPEIGWRQANHATATTFRGEEWDCRELLK